MKSKRCLLIFLCMLLMILLCSCGGSSSDSSSTASAASEPPVFSPPEVLVPSADGTEVYGESPLTLDLSNKEKGYFIACYENGGDKKANVQLIGSDGVSYSYFLTPGENAVIPFTHGNDSYQILCYQQVSEEQYAALFSQQIDIELENIFLPYMYPNQYVNFTPQSEACKLALSLLDDDATDIDALDVIYTYVTEHITYDYEKAETVEAGYLPDVDETLETGTGICFDYAALIAAMLRSRDIPCKLQIGYAGSAKHSWIDVYIRSKGWVENAISFDGDSWSRLDPTFASNAQDEEEVQDFINDNTNYTVQFSR